MNKFYLLSLVILPVTGCLIGSGAAVVSNMTQEVGAANPDTGEYTMDSDFIEAEWTRKDKNAVLYINKQLDVNEINYEVRVDTKKAYTYEGTAYLDEEIELKNEEVRIYSNSETGSIMFVMKEDYSIEIITDEEFKNSHLEGDIADGVYDAKDTKKVIGYYPDFTKIVEVESEIEYTDYIEVVEGTPIYYEIWRQSLKNISIPVERTIVLQPDIIKETIESLDISESIQYKNVMNNCYLRFQGGYVCSSSAIEDQKKFKEFHLNDRNPADSEICVNQEDEDLLIEKRKTLFESAAEQLVGDIEFVFYENKDIGGGFAGLYLSGGQYFTDEVTLSTGTYETGLYFNEIDWNSGGIGDSYTYTVKDDHVNLTGKCVPFYTNTGGIVSEIAYDINLYFTQEGTVLASGGVIVKGLGSETLEYKMMATAVEGRADGFTSTEYNYKATLFAYESVIETQPKQILLTDYINIQIPFWEKVREGNIPTYETRLASLVKRSEMREKLISQLNWKTSGIEVPVTENVEEFNEIAEKSETVQTNEEEVPEVEKDLEKEPEEVVETVKPSEQEPEVLMEEEEVQNRVSKKLVKLDPTKIKVESSSELHEENISHSAYKLLDGRMDTAWVEGVDGVGVGEGVIFSFDESVELGAIKIANGYFKSQKTYDNNGKVSSVYIELSNGGYFDKALTNQNYKGVGSTEYTDTIEFEEGTNTEYVGLIIADAYKGLKYDDTCISEIVFYVYEEEQ